MGVSTKWTSNPKRKHGVILRNVFTWKRSTTNVHLPSTPLPHFLCTRVTFWDRRVPIEVANRPSSTFDHPTLSFRRQFSTFGSTIYIDILAFTRGSLPSDGGDIRLLPLYPDLELFRLRVAHQRSSCGLPTAKLHIRIQETCWLMQHSGM